MTCHSDGWVPCRRQPGFPAKLILLPDALGFLFEQGHLAPLGAHRLCVRLSVNSVPDTASINLLQKP